MKWKWWGCAHEWNVVKTDNITRVNEDNDIVGWKYVTIMQCTKCGKLKKYEKKY